MTIKEEIDELRIKAKKLKYWLDAESKDLDKIATVWNTRNEARNSKKKEREAMLEKLKELALKYATEGELEEDIQLGFNFGEVNENSNDK